MTIPKCFMVVDDDPTNNMLLKYTITRFSSTVNIKLFTEPETALEAIKEEYHAQNIPTVLFLDINMPFMTGWEFLDVFKDFSADIQKQFIIYIVSSSVDNRDKEKARSNPNVAGYLSKPITVDILNKLFS